MSRNASATVLDTQVRNEGKFNRLVDQEAGGVEEVQLDQMRMVAADQQALGRLEVNLRAVSVIGSNIRLHY